MCQLSNLYAYNGLMMSSGKRIDGIEIDKAHRVIVIDNPTYQVPNVPVITAEDADGAGNMRMFRRVERTVDSVKVTGFDGEGLISKEYAAVVDKVFCGGNVHTSFQIRMPYVKGMLHKVDFKDFYKMTGTKHLTDIGESGTGWRMAGDPTTVRNTKRGTKSDYWRGMLDLDRTYPGCRNVGTLGMASLRS